MTGPLTGKQRSIFRGGRQAVSLCPEVRRQGGEAAGADESADTGIPGDKRLHAESDAHSADKSRIILRCDVRTGGMETDVLRGEADEESA